jgi:hypothetical protein
MFPYIITTYHVPFQWTVNSHYYAKDTDSPFEEGLEGQNMQIIFGGQCTGRHHRKIDEVSTETEYCAVVVMLPELNMLRFFCL